MKSASLLSPKQKAANYGFAAFHICLGFQFENYLEQNTLWYTYSVQEKPTTSLVDPCPDSETV